MTILDTPIISRIRRNHGLEHATLNILSAKYPTRRLAGYSFPGGFFVLGDVPTDDLRQTAAQALERLNAGERRLAIHPGCGTNYLTSGFIAGLLAWMGLAGAKSKRDKLERLPLVISLVMFGLIVGQPLGPLLQQRVTTSGDPQGLVIADIFPIRFGGFSLHRVVTQDGN